MKMSIIAAGTALLLTQAASAQTTARPSSPNAQAQAQAQAQAPQQQNQQVQDPQQQIKTDMQQSGFSDVKVMAESYLVRAKDKSGNPIIMIINPDSVSEVVTNRSVSSGGTFITPSGDKFVSNLVGLEATTTPIRTSVKSRIWPSIRMDLPRMSSRFVGSSAMASITWQSSHQR
jgi:hypothetical protein